MVEKLQRQANLPPTHLTPREWLVGHAAGLGTCLLGLVSITFAAWITFGRGTAITTMPDARVTVPLFVAALAVGLVSVLRKERAWALPIAGVGMAAAALALGWLLVVAIVVAVMTLVMLALSHVF